MRGAYLRPGLLVGAAVFLAGHFATQGASEQGSGLFLFWAVTGLGLGLLVAFALERTARANEAQQADESSPRTTSGELKAVIPTSSKFYAVSRKPSSSELKALAVDAPTIPGNPISTRLQLIVERYDAYTRVALSEGSWLDYSVWEVADRARDFATSRVPASSSEVQLAISSVWSEGPLAENGRSPAGWSFGFVDGALGVHCLAVVTDTEMLLIYTTAVSYPRHSDVEQVDPAKALELLRETHPELAKEPVYFRAELPREFHLLTRWPLRVFEVLPGEGTILEAEPDQVITIPDRDEAMTVATLTETLTVGADTPFRQDLLAGRASALRSGASEVFDAHGPVVVGQLAAAAKRASSENPEAARALLQLLGYTPSNLALLSLERLADELPPEVEGIAFSLFDKRRHDEIDVRADPLADLDFVDSRALLGKTNCQRLSLRSTYNPEADLVGGLERQGLKITRVRLLSGDTELMLSASLATADRRTEGCISSSPLPVPCHVLRIVGAEAEALAEKIRNSDLVYSRSRIIEDVLSGRPYDIHRGALYMAAMNVDAPDTFDALEAATQRHRTNVELRRACLAALAGLTNDGVDAILEAVDDPDLLDLARELLERRRARAENAA